MPSAFGHALFGSALGAAFRAPRGLIIAAAACAAAPDLDVIGLRLGIPYEAVLGHRGFSHSLVFAALLGAAAALTLRALARPEARPPLARTFALLFLATASHGLFDALTDGGLGVALLSPFDEARYFLPWRPIVVSPLGVTRFFGARGLPVLRSELLWVGTPSLLLLAAARLSRAPKQQE